MSSVWLPVHLGLMTPSRMHVCGIRSRWNRVCGFGQEIVDVRTTSVPL